MICSPRLAPGAGDALTPAPPTDLKATGLAGPEAAGSCAVDAAGVNSGGGGRFICTAAERGAGRAIVVIAPDESVYR